MWGVAVTDLNSVTRAVLEPHDLTLTRRLNAHSTVTFKVPVTETGADQLLIAERAIKVYRSGVLRFYGKISEPLMDDENWVTVTAHDPFFFLTRRRLPADLTTTADAGAIAWGLINTQNGRSTTRIRQGTIASSVTRARTYVEGEIVAEKILQLAEVDDGFWFLINPVDGVPGTFGEFDVRYPTPGGSALGATFQYGDETVGNLASYSREQNLPLNRVRATGASEGENVLTAYRQDNASISQFDMIEDDRSFPTVIHTATLDEHALEELHPQPRVLYTGDIVDQSDNSLGDVFVPALFDDFDVGDTVSLVIRHGRVDIDTQPQIADAVVKVTDSGAEQLVSVFMTED